MKFIEMQGLDTLPIAFILSGLTSWNIVLLEELRLPQLTKKCLFIGRGIRLASAGGQQRLHDFLEK